MSNKALALAGFIPGEKILAKGYKGAKALFTQAAELYKKGLYSDARHTMTQAVKELKQADVLYAVTPDGSRVKVPNGKMPDHVSASKGSALPVSTPTPVKLKTGENVQYKSNPKHTPGQNGWSYKAGREPSNSLELFKKSESVNNSRTRYTMDEDGNIHRFAKDHQNVWHWSGSTGDSKNPLQLNNEVKAQLRALGWKGKVLK